MYILVYFLYFTIVDISIIFFYPHTLIHTSKYFDISSKLKDTDADLAKVDISLKALQYTTELGSIVFLNIVTQSISPTIGIKSKVVEYLPGLPI